jgi:hypothetical protein
MSHLSPGAPKHSRVGERADVGVDPDLEEEHGDEQVAHGRELAFDARLHRAARQGQAGDEGADDGGELGGVGELGQREGEGQREGDERAR